MRRGGILNEARDNAVLVFTGLSPSAHAASSPKDLSPGWWEQIVGVGRPIDTQRYFVICVNSIGSCFGSSGPASVNPATGESYRLSFPVLMLQDVARGAWEVIRSLKIEKLHTTVGPSMGGMSALAFEILFPGISKRVNYYFFGFQGAAICHRFTVLAKGDDSAGPELARG